MTAEVTAQDAKRDRIYLMTAVRTGKTPKALEFANPACRPEGSLPPLVLNLISDQPRGMDAALGRVPKRNAAAYVRAIRAAKDRSIHLNIDDSGGDGDGALAIARALLEHECAVSAAIIGRCSSGAAIIALAADSHRRSIVAEGSVLIHGARRIFTPEAWENHKRLPSDTKIGINDQLCDIDDAFAAIIGARLDVSDETARQWLAADEKWTAATALAKGFVQSIAADLEAVS
jgi:ATP-dependent protease ClpP protease subunit